MMPDERVGRMMQERIEQRAGDRRALPTHY
jgi:hypothetical protein